MIQMIITIVIVIVMAIFVFGGDKISFLNKVTAIKKGSAKNIKGNYSKETFNKQKVAGTTQDLINFKSITQYNDMGIVLKENDEYVGILEVLGININLLSPEEIVYLESNFQRMLNGIDYPVQIYIQSKRIDIDNYLENYKESIKNEEQNLTTMIQKYELLKKDGTNNQEIVKLEFFIRTKKEQIAYGYELVNYIASACKHSSMIEKRYYIIIKHKHDKSKYQNKLSSDEKIAIAYNSIANKLNSLISALKGSELDGKILNGVEVAEVQYIANNRTDSKYYKLKRNALRSKFSHYVTTAKPIELKNAEILYLGKEQ